MVVLEHHHPKKLPSLRVNTFDKGMILPSF